MARLIDADALKEKIEFQQEHMWPEDLLYRIPEMIDNAPTIPAIPFSWIIPWCFMRYMETNVEISVPDMIEAWWKEQETRT